MTRRTRRTFFWVLLLVLLAFGCVAPSHKDCHDACEGKRHDGYRFDHSEWQCYCVDEVPLKY